MAEAAEDKARGCRTSRLAKTRPFARWRSRFTNYASRLKVRIESICNGYGSAVTDTYSYDAHDKLTGISGGTNKNYAYDSNGNCTSVTVGTSVTSLSYDVENRVTSITYPNSTVNTFQYNGEDLRTQKVDSGGAKNYVCDGSSPASAVLKDGAAVYTPGLSERRGSASKFLHTDALGSTRGITDTTQAATDSVLYDGFGMTVSRSGTTPTPFGFVGAGQYQTDGDSNLQLLGHRYYDPSIGRFLSSDPAKDGTNWYAYCANRPVNASDPTGLTIIPPTDPGDRRNFDIAKWYIGRDPSYRKMMQDLSNSSVDYHIEIIHDGDDRYDDNNHTIYWDPNSAMITFEFGRQTPALGLAHEMDHAWGYDKGIVPPGTDPDYDWREERRVIAGRESKFAKRFGESVRRDHFGIPIVVHGPLNRYN